MSEGSTPPPSPPTLLTTPGINVDSDSDLTPQEGSSDLEYDSESTSESESHSSALNDPGSTLHDNQDYVPPLQDSPDSQQVDATPPPSPIIQQVYATSPRNIFRQEMPSAQTRKLVRDAAPAGGRCVVTLVKIGKPEKGKYAADIAYCHAIARSILWSLIRTVEWYLGMAPGTLNVNSRYNIFLMRFDIHPWFDGMGFVWIPASLTLLHEMERLVRHNNRQTDPKKRMHFERDGKIWKSTSATQYRLVVVHMDPSRSWTRERVTSTGNGSTSNVQPFPTRHDYPFTDATMQNIEMHLNPFYALFHARFQVNKAITKGYIDETFWSKDEGLTVAEAITENFLRPQTVPTKFMNAPGPNKMHKSPTPKSKNPPAIWSSGRVTRSVISGSQAGAGAEDFDDVFSGEPAATSSSSRPATKKTRLDVGQSGKGKGKETADMDSQSVDSESRGQKRPLSLSP